ncbi:MAG: hypothetical protein RRY08_04270 [Christensenella sp.]
MAALPEPLITVQSRKDYEDCEGETCAVQALIDRAHEKTREAPRAHLGASLLGHPCDRWLWLTFRWAVIENFDGRMLRLFRRGQREEETIVRDLRMAGISISHTCLDDDGQSRVDFGCHVSGSIDGIIDRGVPGAECTKHIAEFKTHSLKSFAKLKKEGVKEAKRQHWCQMQVYMLGKKLKRALYVAVCKDNDEMYTERIYFNKEAAEALVARGHYLTLLERIPEPLSTDSSWYQCKYCAGWDFCFGSKCTKEVNCRKCCHVTAFSDSTFKCARFNQILTADDQLLGCEDHVMHPDLVPWIWKGGSSDNTCAKYIINGKEILNGPPTFRSSSSKALLGLEPDTRIDVDIPF